MADNEQYRGQIDGILAKLGIDWRRLRGTGIDKQDVARAEAWANANPNDPMAQRIKANPAGFVMALGNGVKALNGQGDIFADDQRLGLVGGSTAGALGIQRPEDPNAAGAGGVDEQARISDWIRQFTEEMSRNVGPGDPMFDSLSKLGAARASMGVGQSGVRVGRGGLGELAIQQGAMNATQPYVMQRKQLAQQGLGMMDQRDRGLESLRQGAAGLQMQATGLNNQLAMQQFGQQQDAAGGVGGAIGGVLGGLAGGIATVATGGAAAPIIPGLIAGGAQAGAGFGQMSVPRPSMQTYRPYGAFGKPAGGF